MANVSNWKSWERFVGAIFGWKRNIGSGRNNRHDDGEPTIGDVRVPPDYRGLNIECKVRAKFMHHNMFREIQADAPDKVLFLFTHRKREAYQDGLVMMDVPTFQKLWDAGGKEAFKDEQRDTPTDDPVPGWVNGTAPGP